MSVPHDKLLLLKNAAVNRNLGFDDVCKEKKVSAAYNNERGIFEVFEKGKMLMKKYPLKPIVRTRNVAYEFEIQEAFFQYNNITKCQWRNANYNWGTLNKTTGQWSGAVGMIQRDEADYAIWGFAVTHPRSRVAAFSPGVEYAPKHWLTRYPNKLPLTWNLFGLFTKEVKS